ncbi:MAG: hypothetical protein ABWX84_08735 [Nocardioides sp.]
MKIPTRSIRTGIVALALATTAIPLALAAPATASDGDVVRRGSCSGSTDWKLKAKHDDGRLEVEGEVDSNRNGQDWRWRMVHNGSVSARGLATTKGPSGSFERERRMVNLRGTDKIVFKARNPRTGEVCRGVVRI